jgi:hypothetical protein
MRYGKDKFDGKGNLQSGFDYDRQCWVEDYMILRCGHPETMDCGCFGKLYEGKDIRLLNQIEEAFK